MAWCGWPADRSRRRARRWSAPSAAGKNAAGAWEALWAQLDLAQCLIRMNRHADAAEVLAAVRARAEAIGSPPMLARADELTKASRGRGHDQEPWRPLTVREFEVARLIAEGMTNAADRRRAVRLTEDGERPRRAHPRQAGCRASDRGCRLGRGHSRRRPVANGHDHSIPLRRPLDHRPDRDPTGPPVASAGSEGDHQTPASNVGGIGVRPHRPCARGRDCVSVRC